MKKTKKRPVTLLELLIAMALTMMIMSALAYFYRQIDAINQESETQQEALFKQLYVSTRLNDILPKTVYPQTKKKDFFFYTSNTGDSSSLPGSISLMFTYDNGIKLDPQFSNHVLGRLFVDKENRLCIAVWPSPARWEEFHPPPMKCEILMENIAEISYRFYIPPKKDREKVWKQADMKVKLPEDFPETPEGIWKSDWPASWQQLPAIIEISLMQKSVKNIRPIVLTYPLTNSNFIVVY